MVPMIDLHNKKPRSPLEIFPEEIWLMIFSYLEDDPDDFIRCYYACPLFQSLLEVKMRGKALFIVNSYLHKYLIKRWFTHADVMNLRLVSKSWQRSVDYYFQHDQREYTNSHVFPAIRFSSVYPRVAEQLSQSITQEYRGSNWQTNPFVSRRLKVHADFGYLSHSPTGTMDPKFLTMVREFVKVFGKHFWHMRFYAEINVFSAVSCFQFLYQCLRLLPNLQSLSLETSCPRFHGPRGTSHFDGEDLKEFVIETSFPKLNNLSLLSIKDVATCLTGCALEANPHVKNVDLFCGRGFPFNPGSMKLDKLSELYIYLHNIPEDMIKLAKLKWPLRTLTIQYSRSFMNGSSPDNDEATVEEVRAILFRTVENFADTLTNLRLDIDFPCHPNWRLWLPHLQELSASFNDFVTLDFILLLHSLKRINMEMFTDEYSQHQLSEVIQFQHKADCLQDSNIWSLLPKLQVVVIDLVGSRTCIKPLGRTGSWIGSRMTRSRYKIYTYHRWLNNEIVVQVE